jgi:hypothetical protein
MSRPPGFVPVANVQLLSRPSDVLSWLVMAHIQVRSDHRKARVMPPQTTTHDLKSIAVIAGARASANPLAPSSCD